MGNYQEYLKMMPSPLRELDPDQPKRLHTFGNPFKQDKKVEARVEPADVCLLSGTSLMFSHVQHRG